MINAFRGHPKRLYISGSSFKVVGLDGKIRFGEIQSVLIFHKLRKHLSFYRGRIFGRIIFFLYMLRLFCQRKSQDLINFLDQMEFYVIRRSLSIFHPGHFLFSSGSITSLIPARLAARSFSFKPPIGSTFPRRVISPVIAMIAPYGYLGQRGSQAPLQWLSPRTGRPLARRLPEREYGYLSSCKNPRQCPEPPRGT